MENIKEIFASFGLWSLVKDFSDDGTGIGDDLQLTKEGSEVQRMIEQELDKAREEGFNDGVEKTVGIIQKELDKLLLQKDGENYWVGDILRDCGYTVETILPKNMKGYLVKLKTKEDGK